VGSSCFSPTLTLFAVTPGVVDVEAEAAAGWLLKKNESNAVLVSALRVNSDSVGSAGTAVNAGDFPALGR
jgi:hypothetical protein